MRAPPEIRARVHEVRLAAVGDGTIQGHLDGPRPGDESPTHDLSLHGWAVGTDVPLERVVVRFDSLALATGALDRRRPDVREALGLADDRCGFAIPVSLLGLPADYQLLVNVVGAGGGERPLATVDGLRRPLPPGSCDHPLRPLLITTLGRSGSTWLSLVLGRHPELLVHEPFRREARALGYWASVLGALGHPRSYPLVLAARLDGPRWWLGDGSEADPYATEDPLRQWLGGENLEALASSCRERVLAMYAHLCDVTEQPRVRYFVEKVPPDGLSDLARELFPHCREIFLIRDPRDIVASVLSFNRKRRIASFGREQAATDEEFIQRYRADLLGFVKAWRRRRERAVLVRYEELVREPVAAVCRLLEHLEVERDPGAVAGMLADDADDALVQRMRDHRTSADLASSVGRWRHDLSPTQQAAAETAFGDLLAELGYA